MNLLPTIYWGRSFRHFVLASRRVIDRSPIVCNAVVPPKPVIDIAEVWTRSASVWPTINKPEAESQDNFECE